MQMRIVSLSGLVRQRTNWKLDESLYWDWRSHPDRFPIDTLAGATFPNWQPLLVYVQRRIGHGENGGADN